MLGHINIKTVQLVTFIVKDYVTCEFTCINACPLPDLTTLIDMLHIATYKSTSRVSYRAERSFLDREATE